MNKLLIYIIVVLFLLNINPLKSFSSEYYPIDKALEECCSKNFMTAGMNKCTYNGIKEWNKEIEKYSKRIKNILSKKELELFNNSNSAWDNYYNSERNFLSNSVYNKDGDIHTTFEAGNLYELSKQRAINLKRYFYELTK